MPAGNTCSGHSSGPVLWCMQGVRPCHFIDTGFCQPTCVTPQNLHLSPLVPFLWCMQGVNTCHFIDPGFCQPACVAPKTRVCHSLCNFMVSAGCQYLSFYRPWLLLTRICHPQNPHVSPPVLFFRSCRESDPSFCQSRHALKQSMWLVWLHSSFMFIWNQQGSHMGSCKKKPEAPQKQSKPEEKLRAA